MTQYNLKYVTLTTKGTDYYITNSSTPLENGVRSKFLKQYCFSMYNGKGEARCYVTYFHGA